MLFLTHAANSVKALKEGNKGRKKRYSEQAQREKTELNLTKKIQNTLQQSVSNGLSKLLNLSYKSQL